MTGQRDWERKWGRENIGLRKVKVRLGLARQGDSEWYEKTLVLQTMSGRYFLD